MSNKDETKDSQGRPMFVNFAVGAAMVSIVLKNVYSIYKQATRVKKL